jgi:hypothetical protein
MDDHVKWQKLPHKGAYISPNLKWEGVEFYKFENEIFNDLMSY